MKTLEQHEQFEMIVLDEMRKIKILEQLVFGGGTMLRLCFELPRYSVDLDFYINKQKAAFKPWAKKMADRLKEMGAQITDEQEKHFSFLWEFKLAPYPRKLKIEVRKKAEESQKTELNIAHSNFSSLQVRLRTLTLEQMWINKVRALSDRAEIRDAYDLEFLTRRHAGDFKSLDQSVLKKLVQIVNSFSEQEFKSKLGSVLDQEEREVVLSHRFSYLKSKLTPLL